MDRFPEAATFVEVVDAGSFSEVARRRDRSPSAISKQIAHLEDRLGVLLLQRTTRKLRLTSEGEVFLERCRSILAEFEEAERAVTAQSQTARGLLRVTAPITFGHYQLARHLQSYFEANPEVEIDLQLADRFVDLVEEGIDVAIRIGGMADSGLIRRKLADNRRILCASPAYLDARGRPQEPDDLEFHNCIGFSTNSEINQWPFVSPEGQVLRSFAGNIRANNGETLLHLALNGLGVVRISAFMAGPDLEDGSLELVLADRVTDASPPLWIVYPSRRHLAPKSRTFIDFLIATFRPISPWET